MNAEYLLDAMGLLDDDLIREAEEYTVRKRAADAQRWIGLAASLAVVLVLGYGVFQLGHIGMGGSAPSNEASGGAANAPSGSYGEADAPPPAPEGSDHDFQQSGGDWAEPGGSYGGDPAPQEPASPGATEPVGGEGDWLPALRVDGIVYRATQEFIHLEPEEGDIRYTTSCLNTWEPEEDGQANFEPVGSPYVVLDNGTVAVLHDGENSWQIYDSVPPWEK